MVYVCVRVWYVCAPSGCLQRKVGPAFLTTSLGIFLAWSGNEQNNEVKQDTQPPQDIHGTFTNQYRQWWDIPFLCSFEKWQQGGKYHWCQTKRSLFPFDNLSVHISRPLVVGSVDLFVLIVHSLCSLGFSFAWQWDGGSFSKAQTISQLCNVLSHWLFFSSRIDVCQDFFFLSIRREERKKKEHSVATQARSFHKETEALILM